MKKKLLVSLLAATACLVSTFGITACNDDKTDNTAHTHNWSAWTVSDENKPSETATGKATRTCSGTGDCDGTASDKEYELPALSRTDYSLTGDTATCIAAGTATYAYNKDGVSVSFTAATPINANAHDYTTYTYTDGTGHWQVCGNDSTHTTEKKEHDTSGTDGACSKCTYKDTTTTPEHTHTKGEWVKTDSTGHYKLCTDTNCPNPTEKIDEDTHNTNGTDGACSVCGYKATAVTPSTHTHNWGEGEGWTVTDENKPDATKEGKATRTCSGAGECDGKKEHTLPVLTSTDYQLSDNTATCSAEGTATYTYNQNGVEVSFTAATPIDPDAHDYTEEYNYTYTGELGHCKFCYNNHSHITGIEAHDTNGQNGSCSVCHYAPTPDAEFSSNDSVTINVGGGKTVSVNAYAMAIGWYTFTYTGETPITIAYSYYILGTGTVKDTVTLSASGEHSFVAYLESRATCVMKITSESTTAFDATITKSFSLTEPTPAKTLNLNAVTTVNATYAGVVYEYTAEVAGDYSLACTDSKAVIILNNGSAEPQALTLPYDFPLTAGQKVSFLMCTADINTPTANYEVTLSKHVHSYVAEITWDNNNIPVSAVISCEDCEEVDVTVTHAAEQITCADSMQIASCTQEGFIKRTATIVYDGQTITEVKTLSTTEKLAHTYAWTGNEDKHWQECEVCHTKNENVEEGTHTYSTAAITKHPTATEKGERTYTCKCGQTKTEEFNGVVSSCDISSIYAKATVRDEVVYNAPLVYINGTYYHKENENTSGVAYITYLTFSDLTPTASKISSIDVTYSLDGEEFLPAHSSTVNDTPVAYLLNSDGTCILRFNKVNDEYPTLTVKLSIYVTVESIGVEKTLEIAPTPILETPQVYVYSESKLAYEYVNVANTTLYAGQQYQIKALGYTVTVGEQTVTLNDEGIGTYTVATAGEYTVTVTSLYDSRNSHTATLTVSEVPNVTAMLDGTYAGGDYTVTFGDGTITVSKEDEDDIPLTYNTDDGFATSGSNTVSVVLTPTYKLVLVNGEENTVLAKQDAGADATIRTLLGGTRWEAKPLDNDSYQDIISVSFNTDGTGTISKTYKMYNAATSSWTTSVSTFNITYSGTQTDGGYKLQFTLADGTYTSNAANTFEFGVSTVSGDTKNKTGNDFSIINKNSTVSTDGSTLTLNLLAGGTTAAKSSEKEVTFSKVVATD